MNEMEEMDNILVLNDDEGNELNFEFLDVIEYRGKEYVVLLPCDEESDEVVVLEIEGSDEDSVTYAGVEDDAVLAAVFEIFKEKFKDEFDFED